MPRKPLGLRPIRESVRQGAAPKIATTAYLLSDGTDGLSGQPVARDRAEARAWWPRYRRPVWAATRVGHMPRAAMEFDRVTTDGLECVRWCCQHPVFDLAGALAAVNSDRSNLTAFRRTDPDGAASIADYLDVFEKQLDAVEAEARRLAASADPFWRRGFPQLPYLGRYGDVKRQDRFTDT